MITVHDRKAVNFDGGGLAALTEAKDVCIKRKINGDYTLTLTVPKGSVWNYIFEEQILKCRGQLFRIKTIEKNSITAQAIYFDAGRKHLQYVPDIIGETPRNIMLTLFAGTNIRIMTEKEVSNLGMEWVTKLTDFFEASKITPIGGLNAMLKTLESQKASCELYIDNDQIALVKRMGKDNGARVDVCRNAKEIKPKRDTTQLVTRLYPYGKNDLHIDSVTTGSRQYIDSPNKDNFGVCEGFMNFDAIDDPEELLAAAKWQFSEENVNRIDVPQYSYTADFLDVSDLGSASKIGLGDIVTVIDRDFDMTAKQRIVEISEYPYEGNRTRFTIGTPGSTVEELFDGMLQDSIKHQMTTNEKGELKTSWLECMQKNETISINNDLNSQEIAQYRTGALFVSPSGTSAVAIINGRVAISNRKVNGKWHWTTVADGGKMLVNEVWTGILYTSLVSVMSDDGDLNISDRLITIKDGNKLRMRIGYAGNKYVFEVYKPDGVTKTIYLDDSGNAVFTGEVRGGKIAADTSIDVTEDVNVGANINLNASNYSQGIHLMRNGKSSITVNDPAAGGIYVTNAIVATGNIYANSSYPVVTGQNGQKIQLRVNGSNLAVYSDGNYVGYITLS